MSQHQPYNLQIVNKLQFRYNTWIDGRDDNPVHIFIINQHYHNINK